MAGTLSSTCHTVGVSGSEHVLGHLSMCRLSVQASTSHYCRHLTLDQRSHASQGMPTGSSTSMTMRYDSEHRRALDTMKGDRQKEIEKLKAEAAASLASLQTITVKLDKVSARKSILEQEVNLSCFSIKSANMSFVRMALLLANFFLCYLAHKQQTCFIIGLSVPVCCAWLAVAFAVSKLQFGVQSKLVLALNSSHHPCNCAASDLTLLAMCCPALYAHGHNWPVECIAYGCSHETS